MKWYNKLGKFFAIICSIIYSIILIGGIMLFFMSSFFKGNIYTDILKSVDLSKIKLSDIDPKLVSMFGNDVTLEKVLVMSLEDAGIDSDIALEIVKNDEIKEVVGEFFGECINYTVNKDEVPKISNEDVDKIIDNIDVNEINNKQIDKKEIMEYVDEINNNAKSYLKEGFNYADGIN